ncbi:hypothetical protein M8J76_007736 [Diaphorina citri]|nr:hypothetical protein M8J76_007736 [Diaphorina citri]
MTTIYSFTWTVDSSQATPIKFLISDLRDSNQTKYCYVNVDHQSVNSTSGNKRKEITIATEWHLYHHECKWNAAVVTLYFLGVILGSIPAGLLADRFGRRVIMLISFYGQGAISIAIVYNRSFPVYLILRTMQGFFVQGLQNSTYTLLIELFPTRWRIGVAWVTEICWTVGLVMLSLGLQNSTYTLLIELFPTRWRIGVAWVTEICWTVGLVMLSLVSYWFPNWRDAELVTSLPFVGFSLFYVWFIPESPLWKYTKNKIIDFEYLCDDESHKEASLNDYSQGSRPALNKGLEYLSSENFIVQHMNSPLQSSPVLPQNSIYRLPSPEHTHDPRTQTSHTHDPHIQTSHTYDRDSLHTRDPQLHTSHTHDPHKQTSHTHDPRTHDPNPHVHDPDSLHIHVPIIDHSRHRVNNHHTTHTNPIHSQTMPNIREHLMQLNDSFTSIQTDTNAADEFLDNLDSYGSIEDLRISLSSILSEFDIKYANSFSLGLVMRDDESKRCVDTAPCVRRGSKIINKTEESDVMMMMNSRNKTCDNDIVPVNDNGHLPLPPPASHPPPPSLLSLEEDTVAIARDKLLRQLNKCVQRECCRRKTLDELLVLLEQKRLTKNDVRNVFATSISYYGVTFSVPALSGDRFQNFCYGAGFELVFFSVSFFVLSKIGRKKPLVAYFLSSSILFVCVFLLSLSRFHLSASVKTLLVLLGKGTIVGAFFCIFVYCAELFPTPMRAACSGMTSLCCRIGSLLSPYFITYTMKLSPDSMLLCIGVATFIAAILTFCLPETHRKKLPDTVADALNLNCDQEIKENRRS